MNGFPAIVCLILSVASFGYFVLYGSLFPLMDEEVPIELSVFSSIFFDSKPPTGTLRNMFMVSRLLLSAAVAFAFLIPAVSYLIEFDYKTLTRDVFLILFFGSVAVFFASLIYRYFYL